MTVEHNQCIIVHSEERRGCKYSKGNHVRVCSKNDRVTNVLCHYGILVSEEEKKLVDIRKASFLLVAIHSPAVRKLAVSSESMYSE